MSKSTINVDMHEQPNPERTAANCARKAKIILVDDHPMLSSGFKQFIAGCKDLDLIGEASTGNRALSLVQASVPDMVVLDIHLPDMGGIELAAKLLENHPDLKILIFSGDREPSLVQQALKLGVRGYLTKDGDVEELRQAISAVLDGRLYFTPEVCAEMLQDFRRVLTENKGPGTAELTDRDAQLLRLISEGRRGKDIAAELGLSPKSIETYRLRLMKKLHCSNTAELIRYAVREGIVNP